MTRALTRIVSIFERLGYTVADGPEIERLVQLRGIEFPAGPSGADDARHFLFPRRAPAAHPHLAGADPRCLQRQQPPIRVIMPGKVYRSDSDQTTFAMFRHPGRGPGRRWNINFADLRALLNFVRLLRAKSRSCYSTCRLCLHQHEPWTY
ncbi:MAG: hypothetical protein IPK27_14915 [Rhodanobacteraceae bacterium]|nr:hypothetical protein [Rhodanobacteraceae bacterium]